MGDSASSISDDIDGYHSLCRQYGEKYVDVYSNHYYWLEEKHENTTNLSFEEYDKIKKRESLEREIYWKERELQKLKDKL